MPFTDSHGHVAAAALFAVALSVSIPGCDGSSTGTGTGGSSSGTTTSTHGNGAPPTSTSCAQGMPGGGPGGGTPAGATAYTGLAYGSKSSAETLDLFVPSTGNGPFPVVVRIHGGAFQGGSAAMEESGTAADGILAQGYALAAVNYRLATEASFPAGAQDVKAAVRWLRANAAKYNLDSAHFASWGESAGGWFAAMLGVTGDQSTVFDDGDLGNAEQSSAVQAVVDWFGPTDFATMDAQQAANPPASCPSSYQQHTPAGSPEAFWICGDCEANLDSASCATSLAESNLISYVKAAKSLPTFVIAHGDDDCNVPWSQSQELTDALTAVGAKVTFSKMAGYSHGDSRFETTQTAPDLAALAAAFGE